MITNATQAKEFLKQNKEDYDTYYNKELNRAKDKVIEKINGQIESTITEHLKNYCDTEVISSVASSICFIFKYSYLQDRKKFEKDLTRNVVNYYKESNFKVKKYKDIDGRKHLVIKW